MSVRRWKRRDPKTGAVREVWMVDVDIQLPDGRRQRERKVSPIQTRRGAEEYERQLRQQVLDGRKKEEPEAPTLNAFVEHFMTESRNNNKPSSVQAKEQALRDHIIPVFGSMRLDEITFGQVEEFKAAMRLKPSRARARKAMPSKWALKKRHGKVAHVLSDKSINNVLAILRKLLRSAEERGLIQHVPRVKLFKVDKPAFDFLDFNEAERLLGAADTEWAPALMVSTKAGLRLGEIIGLQWTDLDLVRGKLHVRRTVWRGVAGTPKGGRARVVDMPDSLVRALQSHRHLKGPFVFCDAEGNHLTPGVLKAPLRRALKRAGIAREEGTVGWHDLRHTYGSHLAMQGVPLKVIQELMGHATIDMTMRYAHLSPETKSSAVKVLDAPARLPDGNTGVQAHNQL